MVVSIDSGNKGIILVVGKEDGITNFLFEYLTDRGYRVLTTDASAIANKPLVSPELILLDIPEAQVNQFEISDYLKDDSVGQQQIPIILLLPQSETRENLVQLPLNQVDYIFKPINQQRLITRIETQLKLKRLQSSLAIKEQQSQILFKLAEDINQSLDLKVVLQKVTADIQKLLNCDRVIISSDSNNYPTLVAQTSGIATSPIIPEIYSHFLAKNYSFNPNDEQQNQQHRIQVIEDLDQYNAADSPALYLHQLEVKAQLMIPISIPKIDYQPRKNIPSFPWDASQDELKSQISSSFWGWLIIHQCHSPQQWQPPEIKFLQHIVKQIAIAISQSLLTEELQQLALHDPLTQVYNHRYLEQQLALEWRRLQRIPSPVSIIICDIDYFETYKDIYGRAAGDQCLQHVAKIISQAIRRPADFVSLYSDEKFAIILPHTPLQGAQKIVQTIQKKIQQLQLPHAKSIVSSFVTLSLGIASTIPNSKESPSLMIEAAEQALYIAKSRGRNCCAIYNQEISQLKLQQQQELTWSKRLHRALEKNLFCLYAQAIEPLDTADRRRHFEILIRLQDQDEVIISPNDFLPIANRYAMMPQIDSWVIENLFTQLAATDPKNYQQYVFAINLSGASLNDDIFLDFLQAKITEYHLDPQLLCFEITESVAINNIPKISTFIKTLKNLGCSFALDDFGTGMSSLTYLKELPVDYIKIDGSFIREINNDSITKSMVTAINNLAQIIGMKTVAEFVEDPAILKTIQDLKVDYAQGFYFGKPCLLNNVISSIVAG